MNGLPEGFQLYLRPVVAWFIFNTCLAFFVFNKLFSIHSDIMNIT